jgi:REP element-mobilizing transposase RayT
MVRGIDRTALFREDRDRTDFVTRLASLAEAGAWTVYAWALIPDHAHLLVRPRTRPLHRTMRSLLTGCAGAFNRRHHRVGHLFQAQFGATRRRAMRAYRAFVAAGIHPRSRCPEFQGGGLLRSQGGWTAVAALRRGREAYEGDERILGSSAFVGSERRAVAAAPPPPRLARDALLTRVCRHVGGAADGSDRRRADPGPHPGPRRDRLPLGGSPWPPRPGPRARSRRPPERDPEGGPAGSQCRCALAASALFQLGVIGRNIPDFDEKEWPVPDGGQGGLEGTHNLRSPPPED